MVEEIKRVKGKRGGEGEGEEEAQEEPHRDVQETLCVMTCGGHTYASLWLSGV